MTIDVPRLRKAMEHITEHPEEWDQSDWLNTGHAYFTCGTRGCLAGTVALQSGADLRGSSVYLKKGNVDGTDYRHISDYAAELLGLNEGQVALLFAGGNSLRMMWEFASAFTDGEIQVPDDLPEWADLDAEGLTRWLVRNRPDILTVAGKRALSNWLY